MPKQTKIKFDLTELEDIARAIGGSMRTRVGVIGSQAAQNHQLREGAGKKFLVNRAQGETLTNATLMLIMMMGSLSRKIPPRDPLLQPIISHRRELIRKLQSGKMRTAFEAKDYELMFALLGVAAEAIVQEAFETGGFGLWQKNAQSTIDAKGSSAPLINTAQLRKSVSSDVIKTGALPQAAGAGGAGLAD